MVFFSGLLGVLAVGLWIFCIIDVLTTPRDRVRLLPKIAWIVVVVLFVQFGAVAWLLAGRPWNARAMTPGRSGGVTTGGGSVRTPTAAARRAPRRPMSPDDDDEFLATLAKRAADERKRRSGLDGGADGTTPST